MQLLSVTVQRGNAEVYRRSGLVNLRDHVRHPTSDVRACAMMLALQCHDTFGRAGPAAFALLAEIVEFVAVSGVASKIILLETFPRPCANG